MALSGWAALREPGPWRWALVAGGALLLLGLAFGAWSWYETVQTAGALQLGEASRLAQEALAAKDSPTRGEAALRKLEEAIARYPGNRLVPQAAYHLGNLRYEARAWEAARGAYTLALAKGASGSLAHLCRLGIAYAWEAEGKYSEALAAYQIALLRLGPADFLYEEGLMGLARAEELTGRPDRALETYRRVLREVPQTGRAADIRSRVASLEKRSR